MITTSAVVVAFAKLAGLCGGGVIISSGLQKFQEYRITFKPKGGRRDGFDNKVSTLQKEVGSKSQI